MKERIIGRVALVLTLFMALAFAVVPAAMAKDTGDSGTIKLAKQRYVMKVGETREIGLADGSTDLGSLEWTSSNPSVAQTGADGKVTAKNQGTATITIASKDRSGSCIVVVQPKTIKIKSVGFGKDSETVKVGGDLKLLPSVLPANATRRTLRWSSSNPEVAAVDSNGVVTGKKVGNVVIHARACDGSGKNAKLVVAVTDGTVKNVKEVQLSRESYTMPAMQSLDLSATINPWDATIPDVVWSSSDKSVATVSQEGRVVAKKPGKAVITVSSIDGSSKSAKCSLTVTEQNSLSITPDKLRLTSLSPGTRSCSVNLALASGVSGNVIWSSSDEGIATVSGSGKKASITAINPGKATITASIGDQKASAVVLVSNDPISGGGLDVESSSPDFVSVRVENVRSNPAIAENSKVTGVTVSVWSKNDKSDLKEFKARKSSGNDWVVVDIPVNTENGDGFFNASNIIIQAKAFSKTEAAGVELASVSYNALNQATALGKDVSYIAHYLDSGFELPSVYDGQTSGSVEANKKSDGLRVSSNVEGVEITTSVCAAKDGWIGVSSDGEYAAVKTEGDYLEAVKLGLEGPNANLYTLSYRVCTDKDGWTDWKETNDIAGSPGSGQAIKAFEIKIKKK